MPSLRYAASLAIAAGTVLVVGSYFRPRETPKTSPQQPAQTPIAVRGSEMRQISDYLSERAKRTAPHLVWVPSTQTTGVRWTAGQVVTAGSELTPVQTVTVTAGAEVQPVTLAPEERFTQGGWVVIAARNAEGGLISSSGLLGGTARVHCGGQDLRRLLFNVPLDQTWAGGAVFDVSGAALGMVVRCTDTWTALTHESIQRLLEGQFGSDAASWQQLGVRVRKAAEAERKVLRLPEGGLFVGEVRDASPAAAMGLKPGDLLLQTGTDKLASPDDLLALKDTVTLVRNGRRQTVQASPQYSLALPDGVPLTVVDPESRLGKAGLQPGDRVENPAQLSRSGPTWIVYERAGRRIGTLLP